VVQLGLLSTARINGEILAAAARTDTVVVSAVASRSRARADAYAREHGIPRAHGSYDELLADPDVDAIYVSLPNGPHHEWTRRALEAGKHVLCEKPYSRRPADVEEAFDLADRSGLVLMEAFMYRHHPQMRRIPELVAGGAIGRLRSINATFGFRLENAGDVRLLPELDGGALMDVGCYCVSGSRLLAGEPEGAQGEQVLGPTGVDLAFHGTLRFPDDVVAQLDASFLVPSRQRLEAVGETGSILVEAPWRADWGVRVVLRRGRETAEEVEIGPGDMFVLELENFASAVEGRASQLLGREDALGQARAIDALYRAAATGASVTV
jgi:D-xylose 1-dehydrogenase (NADP+, D-xylono-1,5-lactone-forming)